MVHTWVLSEFFFFSFYPSSVLGNLSRTSFVVWNPKNICTSSRKLNVMLFQIGKIGILKVCDLPVYWRGLVYLENSQRQAGPTQVETSLELSTRAPLRPLPQLLGAGPVATRLPCRPGLTERGVWWASHNQFRWVWRINELLNLAFFISWSFLLNDRFQIQPTTAMFHLPLYFWFVCLNTRSQTAPLFLLLLLRV